MFFRNQKLQCTWWGNFVDDLTSYLGNIGDEPVIVVLQMCRASRFKGEVRVFNTFDVSKLILNGDFEQIIEFRNSYL